MIQVGCGLIVAFLLLCLLVGCIADALILSPDERSKKCYAGQTEYCQRTGGVDH